MSQEKIAFGLAAKVMASADSTSEAISESADETSISLKAPMWRSALGSGVKA